MPRSRYIYLIRSESGELVSAFTVLYEALAYAAQNNLDPFSYSLTRVCDGKKANPEPVKDWEKARECFVNAQRGYGGNQPVTDSTSKSEGQIE